MKRRRFILAATGGTAALAGCFGSDADDVDDPESDTNDVDDEDPPDEADHDDDDDERDPDPEDTEPDDTAAELSDIMGEVMAQLNNGDTDAANAHIHPDSSRSFSRDSLPEVAYTLEETELLEAEDDDADLRVVLSDGEESATFEYTFREHETEQWRVLDWVVHRDWGEQERDPQATPEDVLAQFISYLNDGNTGDATTLMHPESPRSLSQGSLPQEEYSIDEIESTDSENNQTALNVVLSDGEESATFDYTLQRSGDGPWDIFDWELQSGWSDERSEEDDHDPDAEPEDVLSTVIGHLNDGNTGGANDRLHPNSPRSYAQGSLPQEEYSIEETESIDSGTDQTVLRVLLTDGGESATFDYTFRTDSAGQWGVFDWEQQSDWGDEPSEENDHDPDAEPVDVLNAVIDYLNDGNTGGANDRLHPVSPRSYSQGSLPQDEYAIEETEPLDSGTDQTVLRVVLSDGGDSATFEYTFRRSDAGWWDIFDWELHRDWGEEPGEEDEYDPDAEPAEVLSAVIDYLNDGNTGGASDRLHPESPRSYSQGSLPQEEYVIEETESLDSGTEETNLRVVLSDGGDSATFEYTFRTNDDGQWGVFDWEIVESWG